MKTQREHHIFVLLKSFLIHFWTMESSDKEAIGFTDKSIYFFYV